MTPDDFQSLQNIGCIPWSEYYDPFTSGDPQTAVDYWCPDMNLSLSEKWMGLQRPQNTATDNPYADAEHPIVVDVWEPGIDVNPEIGLDLPDAGMSAEDTIRIIQERATLPKAPEGDISLDVYAPDVIESAPESKPLFEEKPMEGWDDFIKGGLQVLGGQAVNYIESLFGPAPAEITGSTAVPTVYQGAPMVIDVYGRARGRQCKISRAKNPKNPHYGKPVCPRMNPLNPKALARAARRMAGFHHFAMKMEKAIQHTFRKSGIHAPRRTGGRCGTCRKTRCSC